MIIKPVRAFSTSRCLCRSATFTISTISENYKIGRPIKLSVVGMSENPRNMKFDSCQMIRLELSAKTIFHLDGGSGLNCKFMNIIFVLVFSVLYFVKLTTKKICIFFSV